MQCVLGQYEKSSKKGRRLEPRVMDAVTRDSAKSPREP